MTLCPSSRRCLRLSLLFAGALAPAAGCGHATAAKPAPPAAQPSRQAIPVRWVEAEQRLLPDQIVVTGDLRAMLQIDLCSETEGRVVRAGLERGQLVQQGQVLIELDSRDASSRLAEAEAVQAQIEARLGPALDGAFDPERAPDVRLARVNMERAATEAGRYERLVADGAVARSLQDVESANYQVMRQRHAAEIDRLREQFRSLQAQQARVALARKAVDDTLVKAPWDGCVLEHHVDVGQYVRKGDRLASLMDIGELRVALSVPEVHAAAVQRGQQVALAVRSRPGEEFAGEVTWIGPGIDAASRALTIEVLVDNTARRLQPGSFATARIDLPARRPGVVVPAAAIATGDGVHHVFVVDDERVEQRLVQTGRDLDGVVEIQRGLTAGERVVVSGSERLVDGAAVTAPAVGE